MNLPKFCRRFAGIALRLPLEVHSIPVSYMSHVRFCTKTVTLTLDVVKIMGLKAIRVSFCTKTVTLDVQHVHLCTKTATFADLQVGQWACGSVTLARYGLKITGSVGAMPGMGLEAPDRPVCITTFLTFGESRAGCPQHRTKTVTFG